MPDYLPLECPGGMNVLGLLELGYSRDTYALVGTGIASNRRICYPQGKLMSLTDALRTECGCGNLYISTIIDTHYDKCFRCDAILDAIHGLYTVNTIPQLRHTMYCKLQYTNDVSSRHIIMHYLRDEYRTICVVNTSWIHYWDAWTYCIDSRN